MTQTRTPPPGFSTMSDGVHGGKTKLLCIYDLSIAGDPFDKLRAKTGPHDDRIQDVSN